MIRRVLLGILLPGLVVAGCRGGGEGRRPAEPATGTAGVSGRLAAPFPLQSFTAVDLDGRDASLAAWKGQVVVLNVWATWCQPCRREMPALGALHEKYRGRAVVIGLLQDNVTTDLARAFVSGLRVRYPIVRSTLEIESRLPAVVALPTTYVVDAAGNLVAMYVGEVDPAALDREIRATLGR
jgi:thiol-disulfide isomerase/thioredoxin